MASFFEKLKKGMGVEIVEEEPEKTEEELREKPPEESKLSTVQAKSSPKKRKVKKIEVDEFRSSPPFAAARVIETDLMNYPNRNAAKGGEERTFFETETEKTEVKEPKKSEPREPEKKLESSPRGFTLQNLSTQEGQLAVDVYQTDSELVIQSTIAGVKTENLDISIEADTVLIRGNRPEPPEQGEKNYFYQECYWGPFSRQIILPEETDPSRAEAVMKEGVLTIRIPKIEREKKRKITVKG